MNPLTLISWNTNSLRKRYQKGELQWFYEESPDILCIQETKATSKQLQKTIKDTDDYHTYTSSSTINPCFSGVAIYSKLEPQKVNYTLNGHFKEQGRIIHAEYTEFDLLNIYFPSGAGNADKLHFKFNFYEEFLKITNQLQSEEKKVLVCGDFNIAHQEKDLVNPQTASKSPGFLPQERNFLDQLINQGYIDTFRLFNSEPENYTWWSNSYNCREKNHGMRLDYFFATQNLKHKIKDAYRRPDIMGSDHCPIGIEISL